LPLKNYRRVPITAQDLARTASSLEQLVGRFTLAPSDR
jgi:hypothetical protein